MPAPMYRQIADDLRQKIESGELEPATRLPTEIELMEQYNASRNTIRDAIRLLSTRDLVETRMGQGTFVVRKLNPFVSTLTSNPEIGEEHVYLQELAARGRTPTFTRPRVEVHQASVAVADALRIEAGAQVVSRHQQRSIDETPWSLQTSYYPMTLVQDGAFKLLQAVDIEEGVVAYLGAQLGIKQAGYRDTIAVRAPDENETAFFRLPSDGRIGVFEIFRVGFDENGDRIRLTITVYPTDRNRFRVLVGKVPDRAPHAGEES
ncbi:MAG: GntR family transcriptional regulator [Actinobacteria bacterium]|nr:GntR family transcriptional regulator [Actinomycetota bacterium]